MCGDNCAGPFRALTLCHTEMATLDTSKTSEVILNEKDSLNFGATSRLMASVRRVLIVVLWRIMDTFV